MPHPTYSIRTISRRQAKGSTGPSHVTLDAILKFDSEESPYCIYNEYVAMRLGQTLHVPVADGVLASSGDGPLFASLQLSSPGMRLPDVLRSMYHPVAKEYPDEAAALVAFDILIGNYDRFSNFKASTATPHIRVFAAFDHSHALLNVERTPQDSVERLKSADPIVRSHPFFGSVDPNRALSWAKRFAAVPDIYFAECCHFNKPFRMVDGNIQQGLANAIIARKQILPAILMSIMR